MPTAADLLEVDIPSGVYFQSLREAQVQDQAPTAGQTQRRVKVTLIAVGPGNKTDKAFYTQECINGGPAFFEGARCFANHLSAFEKQVQPERRIEQEIGFYTDVMVEGEKLTGILNVFDGESLDQYWDRINAAINYAKKYPGRNIFGVSIHAAGDYKPMQYQGETWKKITNFADVKSCDFVTWPARNGEFTAVLSEAETMEIKTLAQLKETETPSQGPSAAGIFQTLKDLVGKLSQTGAPGAEEVRRIVDQLGTSLKLNKQEESMDPVTQQPGQDPTADVTDEAMNAEAMKAGHLACAESHKKQAEAETEAGKKGHHLKMAERHMKASESFVHAAPGSSVHVAAPGAPAAPAVPPKPGTPEAEQEAKRQAEARQAEEEAKRQAEAGRKPPFAAATESEFKGKYIDLLKDNLIGKAGLGKAKADYLRTVVLEGETDENRIRGKIASYVRAELQEVNRGAGHGAPRQDNPGTGAGSTELKNTNPKLRRILANVRNGG